MTIPLIKILPRFFVNLMVLLIFLFGSASCKLSGALINTPEIGVTPPQTQAVVETLAPTPTNLSPLVILLSPDGSDVEVVIPMQGVLAELAEKNGFRFEVRDDITAIDLKNDVWLVVVVPPDPGILNLAAVYPEVQFLAVGIAGLQVSQNISVISAGEDRPDQQSFLSGYLAAVITQDWRVGVITTMDTPAGRAGRNGFQNGMIFYCGLCRPPYPPFYEYPVFAELSATANDVELQAAVDLMVNNAVKTVYVFPGIGKEALLENLAQAGVNIIGGSTPSEQIKNRWVTTIRVDDLAAVRQIWPRLVNGEKAISLEVPLVMTDQNASLFSPGRQHLVEKLLAEMLAGFIDTGVDPITGELKSSNN